jgi:hypothetical protein
MLENDDGTDFLPMRLVAVLVIASFVLVSAAVYAMEVVGQSSKETARACASKIIAVAAAEYAESCPGSGDGAIVDVLVPANVDRMSFGTTGSNGDSRAEETTACSIRYADGTDELHLAAVPLCSGGPGSGRGGPLVLYPGRYSVRIRTEEFNGRLMATIYAEEK